MNPDLMRKQRRRGTLLLLGAYVLWGFLTLYWKFLDNLPAYEILAHRIIWCLFFMNLVLFFNGQFKNSWQEIKNTMLHTKTAIIMFAASALISANWFIYIWAVTNDRILETSLGYYINPLVTVVLAVVFLKEKLSGWQLTAFILATSGVLYMTLQFGSLPWISLSLALTFGLYGLLKKSTNLSPLSSITLETLLISPVAFSYLVWLYTVSGSIHHILNFKMIVLLFGSGVVTALPLMLFSAGVKLIPLASSGFIQYVSPTIALFIGVFLFNESFTNAHAVTFSCIWLALIIYSLSHTGLLPKKNSR